MRIRTFRTKKSRQYFFNFLADSGEVILKSEGYASREACDNGKQSVLKNASDTTRYERLTAKDGRYYFNLRAANGQVIGTSAFFDSEEGMEGAIRSLQGMGKRRKEKKKITPQTVESRGPSSKAVTEAASSGEDYRDFSFYNFSKEGIVGGFDAFQGADDGRYYFTFNGPGGNTILISRPYTDTGSRDDGIKSVIRNAAMPDHHERHSEDDLYYFTIKNANAQEIGRSVLYAEREDLEAAINYLAAYPKRGSEKTAAVPDQILPADEDTGEKLYKDYKPLAFYEQRIAGQDFGYDTFSTEDQHYFTVNFEGKPVLLSEDYNSVAGRENGIKSVKKNVKNENRYVRKVHPNGKHYFNLLAGNKQEIATSIWFADEKEMERAIRWLQTTGGTRRRKKAQREKKDRIERQYIEKGRKYPCSEITYDTFQSASNQRFYFVFRNKKDKVILINANVRGYASEKELGKLIQDILKFGPAEKNYLKRTTKNGKHYFYIQNDNGKKLARSSLFFNDVETMDSVIRSLACGGQITEDASFSSTEVGEKGRDFEREAVATKKSREESRVLAEAEARGKAQEIRKEDTAKALKLIEKEGTVPEMKVAATSIGVSKSQVANSVDDRYLPCEDYKGGDGFHKFFRQDRKEYFFSYLDDGEVLLRSEGYTSEKSRDNGIDAVIRNAPLKERWQKETALEGRFYYYLLKGANNQEIARSCYYDDEAAMLKAFAAVIGERSRIGIGSAVVGGVLMSPLMLSKKKAKEAEQARIEAEKEARLAAAREEEERSRAAAAAAARTSPLSNTRTTQHQMLDKVDRPGVNSRRWLVPLLLLLVIIAVLIWYCE